MTKTYPIVMDDTFHKRVKEAAEAANKPIKSFILDAVEKALHDQEKRGTVQKKN